MKTDVHEHEHETHSTTTSANSQRGSKQQQPGSAKPQMSQEECMKKMQAAGTPGPAHQTLKALEGQWQAEVKCWKEEGAEPSVTHGKATGRWILNGHFVEEEFHGEMFGKPFTGRGVFGYDNTKQKFTSVWMDDASTAITTSEGKGDSGSKVITLEGMTSCAATGRTNLPMKQVFHLENPNKHIVEMFVEGQKNMEITYTRQ